MTIQDELRVLAVYLAGRPGTDEVACRQAADRIDALESSLREIARFEHPTPTSADVAGEMARRALEKP